MNQLIITKDNYKGYVELLNSKHPFRFVSKKEATWLISVAIVPVVITAIEFITMSVFLSSIMCALNMIGGICAIVGTVKIQNKINFKKIKKEYPYIENYDLIYLKETLINANVIVEKMKNGQPYLTINDEIFKEIKCEEINEEPTLNSYPSIENTLTEETKEKVKVKTKKYMNRGK